MIHFEINSPKYGIFQILIDDEDFERINKWTWHIAKKRNKFRVQTNSYKKNGGFKYLHQFVMQQKFIDHKDGNALNNQKKNLRLCNNAQNLWNQGKPKNNTTGYKGVYFNKQRKVFQVHIWKNLKRYYLGAFTNLEDAANAYDSAAKKLHGEFAKLNLEVKE